jgi:hypothetical protein
MSAPVPHKTEIRVVLIQRLAAGKDIGSNPAILNSK